MSLSEFCCVFQFIYIFYSLLTYFSVYLQIFHFVYIFFSLFTYFWDSLHPQLWEYICFSTDDILLLIINSLFIKKKKIQFNTVKVQRRLLGRVEWFLPTKLDTILVGPNWNEDPNSKISLLWNILLTQGLGKKKCLSFLWFFLQLQIWFSFLQVKNRFCPFVGHTKILF